MNDYTNYIGKDPSLQLVNANRINLKSSNLWLMKIQKRLQIILNTENLKLKSGFWCEANKQNNKLKNLDKNYNICLKIKHK